MTRRLKPIITLSSCVKKMRGLSRQSDDCRSRFLLRLSSRKYCLNFFFKVIASAFAHCIHVFFNFPAHRSARLQEFTAGDVAATAALAVAFDCACTAGCSATDAACCSVANTSTYALTSSASYSPTN